MAASDLPAFNDPGARSYLLARRQALLIELGAIEDLLGLHRSVEPKHRRQRGGADTEPGYLTDAATCRK